MKNLIKKFQKKQADDTMVTALRLSRKDHDFIRKNKISVRLIVEDCIAKMRGG